MKFTTKLMAEIGVAVALAFILDFLKIWRAPQGGSVALTAVPIIIIAFRWGLRPGIIAGTALGFLKLLNGYIVHYAQAILDYPVAFLVIGFAGVFYQLYHKHKQKELYLILGICLAFLVRFSAHVLSGVIFFSHYAPEGTPVLVYALGYNMTFLIPETILTIVVVTILHRYKLTQP